MPTRRSLLAGLALAAVVVIVSTGGPAFVAASGDDPTVSNVSSGVDRAEDQTNRVSTLESIADWTVGQYLGGVGIGLGVGLCIGGFVMYRRQSNRIEETFER